MSHYHVTLSHPALEVMSHLIDHYGSNIHLLSTHVTICFANINRKPECYCKMLHWDHHCVRWELHGWVGQLLLRDFRGQTLWHQSDLRLGVGTFCGQALVGWQWVVGVTVRWGWFGGQRSEDAWIISMHR